MKYYSWTLCTSYLKGTDRGRICNINMWNLVFCVVSWSCTTFIPIYLLSHMLVPELWTWTYSTSQACNIISHMPHNQVECWKCLCSAFPGRRQCWNWAGAFCVSRCFIYFIETLMINLLFAVSDYSTGRVGAPLTCCEIKLRDWVEGEFSKCKYIFCHFWTA